MILNGQLQTSVNGVNIQNGLATQINAKVRCDSLSTYVLDAFNRFNVVRGKSFRKKSKIICILQSLPIFGVNVDCGKRRKNILRRLISALDLGFYLFADPDRNELGADLGLNLDFKKIYIPHYSSIRLSVLKEPSFLSNAACKSIACRLLTHANCRLR
jgi:hypothetical protein